MRVKFSKYSGCGNDFILIDNRKSFFPSGKPDLIQKLCQRCTGVGADGVILLESSAQADFRMRIFNSDGREAEMCGNGIRCLMKFAQESGLNDSSYRIETFLRPLTVKSIGEQISVEMGRPFDVRWSIPLSIESVEYTVHHINTGVPHLVLFTDDLEGFNLNALGPKFRFHPLFAPQGANLNVAQKMPNGELWNRTFERGVEGETLACGTGCAAVAVAASKFYPGSPKVLVRTRLQELLEFHLEGDGDSVQKLTMIGSADKAFDGEFILE